ncbi:unnamed protein product [Schistosoma turkestanicum]|nr:unnamed protein product [Schistosoma turkestanicum]
MSFALLKKAFGIGKSIDDREFDEFLKAVDSNDVHVGQLTKLLRKKAVRLFVLKNEDSGVIFDSSAQKDPVKSIPTISVGRQQLNLSDMAFGSYSLNNKKPLLHSMKIHDMSSIGQVLFTRVFNEFDEWRSLCPKGETNQWTKQDISIGHSDSLKKHNLRSYKTLAVCLLINLEWCSPTNGLCTGKAYPQKSHSRRNFYHLFNTDLPHHGQPVPQSSTDTSLKISTFTSRRFYNMLFEHWTQLSLLIETLSNECAAAVSNNGMSCWGAHKLVPDMHCTEIIAKAFNKFLNYFRDLCLPKLSFPIWPTLNVALSTDFDSLPLCFDRSRADCVANWLNIDPSYSQTMIVDFNQYPKDNLVDVFVRSCLAPLIIKGNSKEHRSFLARLITGILMFHTGWIDGSGSRVNSGVSCSSSSISNNQNMPVSLLDQLLTQTGFKTMGTDSVSCGSIFNCTVISGQSRAYLVALLHFATYFLRFMCLIHTQECLPELGPADLFELEQQKRRTRLGAKSRRKSGSATSNNSTGHSGDAHDSGISSQEDLTSSFYSASTGSSPTHVSGMALCMTHRLTRDQCRMAEVAAHFMVTREAAAAAAAAAGPTNSQIPGGTTRSTDMSSGLVDGGSAVSKPYPSNNSPRSYRSRYTEVPLLIEKFFDGDEELCSCLPIEVIPDSGNHSSSLALPPRSSSSPTSPYNTLDNFKTHCLPICSQSADRSSKHSYSSQSSDRDTRFSSSRVGDVSNVFNNDNMSPSSSIYHTEEELSHTVNPVNHSLLPTLANHSLISGTVTDMYHSGHVLQATVEHPESFKSRLEENLLQWITYGPVIINDSNDLSVGCSNSNNSTKAEESSLLSTQMNPPIKSSLLYQKSRGQMKQLKWSATSLLINCDAKSVEALTLIQPKSTNLVSGNAPDDVNLKSTHHNTNSIANSNSTHVSRDRMKIKLNETEPFVQQSVLTTTPMCKLSSSIIRRIISIKPAPLVFRLIEQIHTVLDATNCSLMTLKHLECNLQLIYLKSSILTNLLISEGSNTLHRVDRMTIAAGCLPEDLPLLLSIASSCSAQVANILHSSHFDWMNM